MESIARTSHVNDVYAGAVGVWIYDSGGTLGDVDHCNYTGTSFQQPCRRHHVA